MVHLRVILSCISFGILLMVPSSLLCQQGDLFDMAERGWADSVRTLIRMGADVDMRDSEGNTPLMLAARSWHSATVELLLESGADVSLENNDHETAIAQLLYYYVSLPLRLRIERLQKQEDSLRKVVDLLLKHRANINDVDQTDRTLLHWASERTAPSLVQLFLQHKADANALNRHRQTPLMLAVKGMVDTGIVTMLLAHGAQINTYDRDGLNALYYAVSDHKLKVMRLLIQAGANVNVSGVLGETPLCKAIEINHEKAAALLRAAGARECDYTPGDNHRQKITPTPDTTAPYGIYIPVDLEDCFVELHRMFHPDRVNAIRSWDERDMIDFHFGLGMYLRNKWGLWGGSRLQEYFFSIGVCHPDDMSGIIFDSFWRHLNGLPIRLDEQIDYYQKHWESQSKLNGE
jgi:ankyrin repeat protein